MYSTVPFVRWTRTMTSVGPIRSVSWRYGVGHTNQENAAAKSRRLNTVALCMGEKVSRKPNACKGTFLAS